MPRVFMPASARHFDPRLPLDSATSAVACLVYDLVHESRPSLVVDIGAGGCSAFFACCQSMRDHDIDGSAYAIDQWKAREGGAQLFGRLNAQARQHYLGICYFSESTAEAAAKLFDDSSIEFLRMDATRAGLGDREVSAWLERLADGGVVLVDGVGSEAGDATWGRTVEFVGRGSQLRQTNVGIAVRGTRPPGDLLELLSVPEQLQALDDFYGHLGTSHLASAQVNPATFQTRARPR